MTEQQSEPVRDSGDSAAPCIWPHDRPHIWTSSGIIRPDQECDRGCGLRYGDWEQRLFGRTEAEG